MAVWSQRWQQQIDTLPERLGGHVFLTVVALLIGIVVSIPLGIWASRHPRVERVALLLASIVQTIPGLALLATMVFLWGTIGWVPAMIALILYSVLPVLRNTVTGIQAIDPAILEAARGVGMSSWQSLWIVQLPLAAPMIVAGIRTASVWVVGAATIAQPVGAVSLGNYIFVGLQTYNVVALAFGCVLSAVLALALDMLLFQLQQAFLLRSPRRGMAVLGGLLCVCLSPWAASALPQSSSSRPALQSSRSQRAKVDEYVIGSKAFTEQYILAHAIKQRLASQHVASRVLDGMGSATVFRAMEAGQVDCYVDYTGTIWANYMRRRQTVSPVEMLVEVSAYLQTKGIFCLGSLGFSNDYAFATTRSIAEQYDLKTLTDLAGVSNRLVGGTDIEFFDRPEWRAVRQAYRLDFAERKTMDPTLMYGAIDSGQLDVIVAFNTDSRLDKYDLVVLEDPSFALPPYDAILLCSQRMVRDPDAMRALRPLLQSMDSGAVRRANAMVDLEGRPIEDASQYLLQDSD